VDLGVHLPLMPFGEEPCSLRRLRNAVKTAIGCGFDAVSVNDHFVFQTAWLDGLTALASVIECSGRLSLATTVSLPVLRGPVALAKGLVAIDVLSEGRLVAGIGPGSSTRDYDAVGVPPRAHVPIRAHAGHAAGRLPNPAFDRRPAGAE
jgi:alkanesulfonate monooxygenase SsuD/methylene tetrahydromethanopterin reductase-like flavin-dependent oxidoreductase (luciferase family)